MGLAASPVAGSATDGSIDFGELAVLVVGIVGLDTVLIDLGDLVALGIVLVDDRGTIGEGRLGHLARGVVLVLGGVPQRVRGRGDLTQGIVGRAGRSGYAVDDLGRQIRLPTSSYVLLVTMPEASTVWVTRPAAS